MPEDERERLFEPFQQRSTTAARGGVGLGLTVARGFVEAMDGVLIADGSMTAAALTMRLRLPLAQRLTTRSSSSTTSRGLRQALRINLARAGLRGDRRRRTGPRRWPRPRAQPPDVVVLDLGLPDMDGTDVIEGLRGWSRAPIIVLSARTGQGDKVVALDAGADDYVTKPFGMDELLARLRAALRRSGTRRRTRRSSRPRSFTIDLAAKQAATPTAKPCGSRRRSGTCSRC